MDGSVGQLLHRSAILSENNDGMDGAGRTGMLPSGCFVIALVIPSCLSYNLVYEQKLVKPETFPTAWLCPYCPGSSGGKIDIRVHRVELVLIWGENRSFWECLPRGGELFLPLTFIIIISFVTAVKLHPLLPREVLGILLFLCRSHKNERISFGECCENKHNRKLSEAALKICHALDIFGVMILIWMNGCVVCCHYEQGKKLLFWGTSMLNVKSQHGVCDLHPHTLGGLFKSLPFWAYMHVFFILNDCMSLVHNETC